MKGSWPVFRTPAASRTKRLRVAKTQVMGYMTQETIHRTGARRSARKVACWRPMDLGMISPRIRIRGGSVNITGISAAAPNSPRKKAVTRTVFTAAAMYAPSRVVARKYSGRARSCKARRASRCPSSARWCRRRRLAETRAISAIAKKPSRSRSGMKMRRMP